MTSPKAKAFYSFFLVLAFGVLIFGGYAIHKEKPPIPNQIIDANSNVLFTHEDIIDGQNYFYSRGGQHIGTIWGHGAYLAPDWSADYLHRTGLYLAARHQGLDPEQARTFTHEDFSNLDPADQARLQALVTQEIKQNRYDPQSQALTLTEFQAEAFAALTTYYTELFQHGNDRMGLQAGIVRNAEEGRIITTFFSWLAWSAGTQRPDAEHTYTTNWPYDPLVGNTPLPDFLIWSIVSVILLIFGIAGAVFVYQRYIGQDEGVQLKLDFPEPRPTASQKVTLIYFLTAIALFTLQLGLGAVTAHYTVEGNLFFGFPIDTILPYAAARTWHIQLAIFFIATCFLAAGLFIGPFVGQEPKGQAVWTGLLFGALVVVVLGTLGGTWSSVMGFFDGDGFLFGHQGYEFIELGRFWQILLIVGMIIWLILVWRAIKPALRTEADSGGLTHMLLYSSIAIPLFYMAGLLYGKGSHLADAEYWRWWVVHLWVEGFFEVFATVVMAFLLSHIGAVSKKFALTSVYFIVFLYLGSGVIGTFHHLYWSGSPTIIVALGAVFSALEVVPLSLLGFEAAHNLKIAGQGGQNYAYRWPIYFFVAVSFWNLVGAGVFGFLINPPIVLYYAQGIDTTPIHSHGALFGVYGMLAISLMLFSVRHIVPKASWSDKLLGYSFWGLNIGLAGMMVLSLIPAGFYQFYFAIKEGLWFARSPEIASGEFIRTVTWLRMLPDTVFAIGALALLLFILRAVWFSFLKKA